MLDLDFAIVGDGGPDGDGLAGNVSAAVESHPTRHRALRPTRQSDFVLDLAVEWLLQDVGSDELSESKADWFSLILHLTVVASSQDLNLIDFLPQMDKRQKIAPHSPD